LPDASKPRYQRAMIDHVCDADGHIIEPGDLWIERLPEELRPIAPHFYRDDEGVFHQRIYGIDIDTLEVMQGTMRPRDMLQNMGLACAMGVPIERVFSASERERHTILDAPPWATDGRQRLEYNVHHGVSRAVLYPTFMLAGGTFTPNLAPAVCAVYNDWILNDYCGGSGGQLIPVAALPVVDPVAAAAEVKRVAELGFRAVFIRTNAVHGKKYSDRSFDVVWQAIVDTGTKLGLHPLPVWDQDGTARGYHLPDIMAASCLGFPMDMISTLYDMMSGGVFDRFPTMPTMILEAGAGWLPSFLERFEEHREMFGRLKAPEWKTPAMEIFLRQMMITVEACEKTDLKIALDFLPADHVALASDWPHYDGTPDLVSGFHRAGAGLRDEDLAMVATGTVERWFG
jgi:predicted TIM-barrel fold metal-dependent hydrolase